MAKFIDIVAFSLAFFLVGMGLISRFLSLRLSIIVLSVIYVFFLGFMILIKMRPKRDKTSLEEMPVYLALMPREEQTALFYKLVPKDKQLDIKSPYFYFEKGGKIIMVAVLYRFLNLTQEDIATAYRTASENGADEIIMLTRKFERKTITLTALLPLPFKFPSKYEVYYALKKHNSLPKKPPKPNKTKIKWDKRELISNIFSPKRTGYYLLSAITLSALSFLTPLKTYYLIMASLSLVLSGITLVRKNR